MAEIFRTALPTGAEIHWYKIESILGQGGFGITYLARDNNLNQQVAIKEYFPAQLATRLPDSSVSSTTSRLGETYRWGLDGFIREAKTLFPIRHPNIVQVHSVFKENNTAYMVMDYHEGHTFGDELAGGPAPDEDALLAMALPLVNGLDALHEHKVIHRDIKPANIIQAGHGPVLIDFGSARHAFGYETHTLTCLVSPGFAPFEQYSGGSKSQQQGAWSDIYALAATLYTAITGEMPVDAATRVSAIIGGEADPLQSVVESAEGRYSTHFLEAIDRALEFHPHDRPTTAAEWGAMLRGVKSAKIPFATRSINITGGVPARSANHPGASADTQLPGNALDEIVGIAPPAPEVHSRQDSITIDDSLVAQGDTRRSSQLPEADVVKLSAPPAPQTVESFEPSVPAGVGRNVATLARVDTGPTALDDQMREMRVKLEDIERTTAALHVPQPAAYSKQVFYVLAGIAALLAVGLLFRETTELTAAARTPEARTDVSVPAAIGTPEKIPALPPAGALAPRGSAASSAALISPATIKDAASIKENLAALQEERRIQEELLEIERARAESQREANELERRRLEQEKERLQLQAAAKVQPKPEVVTDGVLAKQIQTAKTNWETLRRRYTDDHPDVIAAKRALDALRQN